MTTKEPVRVKKARLLNDNYETRKAIRKLKAIKEEMETNPTPSKNLIKFLLSEIVNSGNLAPKDMEILNLIFICNKQEFKERIEDKMELLDFKIKMNLYEIENFLK